MEPLPPATNPLPLPDTSGPINWIKNHKKLLIVSGAVVFLFIFLIFTVFQIFKDRIFKKTSQQTQVTATPKPASSLNLMIIKSSKTTYSLSEKVSIKAIADSKGEPVSAFDVTIDFDPEFLSLTNKKSPTLPDFIYYGSNTGKILRVSAVQKPESTKPQVFDNTTLFEFEFTPKKEGKTAFRTIFIPNATNDSNLIGTQSTDILDNAIGAEIEITK